MTGGIPLIGQKQAEAGSCCPYMSYTELIPQRNGTVAQAFLQQPCMTTACKLWDQAAGDCSKKIEARLTVGVYALLEALCHDRGIDTAASVRAVNEGLAQQGAAPEGADAPPAISAAVAAALGGMTKTADEVVDAAVAKMRAEEEAEDSAACTPRGEG